MFGLLRGDLAKFFRTSLLVARRLMGLYWHFDYVSLHVASVYVQLMFKCLWLSVSGCKSCWVNRIQSLRLWIQADNACKEVRNSSTGKLGCLLTQSGYFTQVSENHLTVGHTHEDVGRVSHYTFLVTTCEHLGCIYAFSCFPFLLASPIAQMRPWL